MQIFILWCGFLGGWLLVAGPVFQAVIELSEQETKRETIASVTQRYTPPPRNSAWWWLLPPVGYLLHRGRARRRRQEILQLWTPQQLEAIARLSNKATGWAMVASAGVLLALRETWGLTEHYHWSPWRFWLLAAGMAVLSAAYTAVRMSWVGRVRDGAGQRLAGGGCQS